MKRFLLLCMTVCFVFLAACTGSSGDPNIYDVEYNGKTYTVDQNNRTITADGYVCQFEISGGGNSTDFEVTYPNGSTYWRRWSGSSGYGGMSPDYDETRYVSGDTLWSVLEQGRPGAQKNSGYWFIGLLLVGFGIFEAVSPRTSWYISYGWRYKDAEPSDLALGLGRIGGIVIIIAGVVCFFV